MLWTDSDFINWRYRLQGHAGSALEDPELRERAERAALRADARYGVDSTALVWLNRLSDYFYLLGRTLTAHYAVDEVLWIP